MSSVSDLDVARRAHPPHGHGGSVMDGRELTESDCGMSSDSFWESDGGYSVDGCGYKNETGDREVGISVFPSNVTTNKQNKITFFKTGFYFVILYIGSKRRR